MKCSIKRKQDRQNERTKKRLISDLRKLNPEVEISTDGGAINSSLDDLSKLVLPEYCNVFGNLEESASFGFISVTVNGINTTICSDTFFN